MTHPNVSPCADVTLTVPAAAADSFRAEVLDNLKAATANLVEGASWFLQHKDLNRLDAEDRPHLATAQALFDTIRDQRGDLMVVGDPEVLAAAVRSAFQQTAEGLGQAVESGWPTTTAIRSMLAPLAVWCDVIDAHDWLAAPDGADDVQR
jgi:hypothetical protein